MNEPELIVARAGRLATIRLNRPAALNSLTLGMVRDMTAALDACAVDPDIAAVLVKGAGERGLCAGGDIRSLYDMRGTDQAYYKNFWRVEYALNARIASFPKPYVAIMDGIVMGGGVGVSAHGSHRIVTERTRLAMPEAGIGFIPDVGGSWLLTRKGGVGRYLALSGAAVGGADAIHAGLADAMLDSARLAELEEALARIRSTPEVDDIVAQLAQPAPEPPLAANAALLDRAMSAPTVEDVIAALTESDSAFAAQVTAKILGNSPTSVKVTHELLGLGARAGSLEQCLVNEFHAACSLLDTHDLYEGIRAAVINKDRKPRWSPATLPQVDPATVSAILAGTGEPEPAFHERMRV